MKKIRFMEKIHLLSVIPNAFKFVLISIYNSHSIWKLQVIQNNTSLKLEISSTGRITVTPLVPSNSSVSLLAS